MMIKSFADKETKSLFETSKSRRLSPGILKTALRKLRMLDSASVVNDLKIPPSNRLESLKGDLKGFYSIIVNDQYRVVFRFDAGEARDVHIIDYHK